MTRESSKTKLCHVVKEPLNKLLITFTTAIRSPNYRDYVVKKPLTTVLLAKINTMIFRDRDRYNGRGYVVKALKNPSPPRYQEPFGLCIIE